jgi:WD40 repeat protein
VAIGSSIAVGTSHGYCLIYDSVQSLKWCLGESHFREEGGSVSSLAVSGNGARLLVGYAKGLILMYDLEQGKLIRCVGSWLRRKYFGDSILSISNINVCIFFCTRSMHDAHAPGTAALVLRVSGVFS